MCNPGPGHISWRIHSYKPNAWLNYSTIRLSEVQWPEELLLVSEGWCKHGYTSWKQLYYNPNHNDAAPTVHLDGHVSEQRYDNPDQTSIGGYTWAPNHGVGSDDGYTVKVWGVYLHPDFTKWNILY